MGSTAEADWQDDFYLHKLKKNRVALVRDLIPDPVVDHLLAEDVISQEEYETVLYCNQTTAGRNRRLLDILCTKGPNGYNEFRHALVQDFKWLAEILDYTARPQPKPVKDVESKSTIIPDISDVTDEDIDMVVQSLLSSGSLMTWKFVARKLGLREAKLTEIEYRSQRDIRTQIYEMLYHWRSDAAFTARYDRLCEVLVEEGRTATAEMIRANHCKDSFKGSIKLHH